jgi:YVTN family beta-propeller protein
VSNASARSEARAHIRKAWELDENMIPKRVWVAMALVTCFVLCSVWAQQQKPVRTTRSGVSTPGVKRDISTLKPIAVLPVEGAPDFQVVTSDAVWVANGPRNTIHKLDAKTNKVVAAVEVGKLPCAGLVAGFGSLWIPSCMDKTLSRFDLKTNQVSATIPVGPADSEGGFTAGPDSIWILTDKKGILSRIDPETNHLVAEIQVPSGSAVCVTGEDGAVWVTSTEHSMVVRVDPKTNLITDRIAVGSQPRFTSSGGGAIWTLNQGDGTVSRIDVRTRKLVASIDLGAPGGGGEIAYGEGFVWVSVFDLPLTQIDPDTNKVIKQWTGSGGDAVRVGHGSIWLSNLRQQNVWRLDPKQP